MSPRVALSLDPSRIVTQERTHRIYSRFPQSGTDLPSGRDLECGGTRALLTQVATSLRPPPAARGQAGAGDELGAAQAAQHHLGVGNGPGQVVEPGTGLQGPAELEGAARACPTPPARRSPAQCVLLLRDKNW